MLRRNVMVGVFRCVTIAVLVCLWLGHGSDRVHAQSLPPAEDSRQSMLREAMLGILPSQANVDSARAQKECIVLPVQPANDRLQGPHGDSVVSTHCEVVAYQALGRPLTRWIIAHYRWTSLFTAEDQTRGPDTRDTVTEEEAVLFEAPAPGQVRPVWHERIETGEYGVWRSITPEVAPTSQGTTLLSVMLCLNGTGGCGQEFSPASCRWTMVWGPAGVARPIAGRLYWPHPTRDPHRPAESAGRSRLLRRGRRKLLSVTAARGRPSVTP
jgi:hypothetical protein